MNENIKTLEKCKTCGNKNLTKVLTLDEQFLSPTFVKSNKDNKLAKIKSPLTLVLCDKTENEKNCGLLQLLEITNPDLLYKEYFYRSATNDTMRTDLEDVVNQALEIAKPNKGDTIVDIGSNDCTLLNFYKQEFNKIGFEPAQNIEYIDEGNNITVINNYFNSKEFKIQSKNKAKIITSCAMFYDLDDPKKFVKDVEEILDEDGIWCCQISYLVSMLKYNNFYDICHEHLSYYSLETFEYLINQFGLKCFYAETNDVNGGSIRLYICKKSSNKYTENKFFYKLNLIKEEEKKFKLTDPQTFYNFEKIISELKDKTVKFVDSILNLNKKVLGLGASTKGNIILQHFGLTKEKIPYISERNPEKAGLKCLGSDIELISEEKAREINPDAFIVLPWNFKKEIVNREKNYLQGGGKLMFVMPYPHIVTKDKEIKL